MATLSVDTSCVLTCASPKDDQRSPLLTDCDVHKIVERKIRRPDFRLLSWRLKPFSESNGYLGQYYSLQTTILIDDESPTTFKFFAKTPPPADSPQFDLLFRADAFNKEAIIYTELLKKMGAGSGPKWFVDCYLCKRDVIIVLDDVSTDGFLMLNKLVPLDEDHCILALKTLARFHSRSLIFDERLRRAGGPTIYELYGHILKDTLCLEGDEITEKLLYSSLVGCKTAIDLDEKLTVDQKIRLKERMSVWLPRLTRLLDTSKRHRNAICHRDVWTNNLMFKRDGINGAPSACYLIDFQFARYCPPAYDFFCLLHLTIDQETRNRCYASCMRIYYDTLKQAIKDEGFNANDILTWQAFQESCVDARYIALVYALMNLQVMLISNEGIAEFVAASPELLEQVLYSDKRADLVRHQYANVPGYKSRLSEIVQEAYEWLPDRPIDD